MFAVSDLTLLRHSESLALRVKLIVSKVRLARPGRGCE